VISDAGGAREVLEEPVAGRIVGRTSEAIAAAVGEVLANPPKREAVATTVAGYSWDANGKALVGHWQSLLTN
jgi:teichuronic acid biosynthesis glycosyltransferase TuaC